MGLDAAEPPEVLLELAGVFPCFGHEAFKGCTPAVPPRCEISGCYFKRLEISTIDCSCSGITAFLFDSTTLTALIRDCSCSLCTQRLGLLQHCAVKRSSYYLFFNTNCIFFYHLKRQMIKKERLHLATFTKLKTQTLHQQLCMISTSGNATEASKSLIATVSSSCSSSWWMNFNSEYIKCCHAESSLHSSCCYTSTSANCLRKVRAGWNCRQSDMGHF